MKTAEQLYNEAFRPGRTPRSPEYQEGVMDWLLANRHGQPMPHRYAPGTVQFDAYHAGCTEGRAIITDQEQA